jgi:hypothetical protein
MDRGQRTVIFAARSAGNRLSSVFGPLSSDHHGEVGKNSVIARSVATWQSRRRSGRCHGRRPQGSGSILLPSIPRTAGSRPHFAAMTAHCARRLISCGRPGGARLAVGAQARRVGIPACFGLSRWCDRNPASLVQCELARKRRRSAGRVPCEPGGFGQRARSGASRQRARGTAGVVRQGGDKKTPAGAGVSRVGRAGGLARSCLAG